jgi:predicted metal-dependent phosphoesterase TrpH
MVISRRSVGCLYARRCTNTIPADCIEELLVDEGKTNCLSQLQPPRGDGILVGGVHFLDNLQFMSVKIDLHCHSFFSGDGVSSPEQLIEAARRKDLNAFVITDHNTCDAITYLLEKDLMREDGLPVNDFLVVPGVEVTTAEGHLLCIGAVLPNLKGRPALEVCHLIHEAGGLAIPPHPYDLFRAGIRENILNTLPIDAIEVFNAASTLKRYNQSAFNYAMRRGLAMTAASDAHHHAAIGRAYTILKTEDFSVRGILEQIPKQNDLNQEYISVKDSLRKTWNNWLRLRKRKSIKDMLSGSDKTEE